MPSPFEGIIDTAINELQKSKVLLTSNQLALAFEAIQRANVLTQISPALIGSSLGFDIPHPYSFVVIEGVTEIWWVQEQISDPGAFTTILGAPEISTWTLNIEEGIRVRSWNRASPGLSTLPVGSPQLSLPTVTYRVWLKAPFGRV